MAFKLEGIDVETYRKNKEKLSTALKKTGSKRLLAFMNDNVKN